MRTTRSTSIVLTATLAAAATGLANPAVEPPRPRQCEKPPAIDPDAIAALRRMGRFLRDQRSFTVRTTTETDYVLDSGQKIRLGAQAELRVRRPDRLHAHVVSDRKDRELFYDGKAFTIYGPRLGFYARVPAPPTLGETADMLEDRYGLELPMVDLFRWGTDEADVGQITSASYVGATKLDGVETDQYAFRQPGVDWQIWIQRGEQALPRKLVLTTTDDPARPERAIEMTWQLGVAHADSEFAFVPPKGSRKITLTETKDHHAPITSQRDRDSRARRERRHAP